MEIRVCLKLLAKYARTQEKFILRYNSGRVYVAQFNSFGKLLLWEDEHLITMGLVILDHIYEVKPINKSTKTYLEQLSDAELATQMLRRSYWKIVLSNYLKRLVLKLEGDNIPVV